MKFINIDWISDSEELFQMERPEFFTNYTHCQECAEHNEILSNATINDIGLNELGNPAWDPICFCNGDGKKYFTPAFIRLSLQTINNEFYFGQFLFHLENHGKDGNYYLACSTEQRIFIANFIKYMIEMHSSIIDNNCLSDEALKSYEIWSAL